MPTTAQGNDYTVRKHRHLEDTWTVRVPTGEILSTGRRLDQAIGTIVKRQERHQLYWQAWTPAGAQAGPWHRRRGDAIEELRRRT